MNRSRATHIKLLVYLLFPFISVVCFVNFFRARADGDPNASGYLLLFPIGVALTVVFISLGTASAVRRMFRVDGGACGSNRVPVTQAATLISNWRFGRDALALEMMIVAGWLRVTPEDRGPYLETCREVILAARSAAGCIDLHLSADALGVHRLHELVRP